MTRRRPDRNNAPPNTRRTFARDERGAIAPMFGLMIIPVMTMAVFGIDFSRALSSRTSLQDSVDAAGLALAHLPSSTTQAQLDAAARSWITVNLRDPSVGPVTITTSSVNRTVTVTATANVATLSGGLQQMLSGGSGLLQIPLRATTTVKWGTRIELALVLDNTFSMNDNNKLGDLKTAATNLVNTLSAATAGNPADLKIGVVPFSVSVNVGSGNQNAAWMSGAQPSAYGADLFTTNGVNRFTLLANMNNTPWGGCVESRPMPYDIQDTAPTTSTPATLFVPFFSPDEKDGGTWNFNGTDYNYINRYKTDSTTGGNKDTGRFGDQAKYTGSFSSSSTLWSGILGPGYNSGPNMGCGIQPLLRMTTDMTAVKSKINAMVASGETHIPIGMVWGWHVLSPNAPFSDGAPYTDVTTLKVTKVAVLVTDGANTYFTGVNGFYNSSYTAYGYADQNRIGWGTSPSSTDTTNAMNSRLAQLCKNMKDGGIKIYTVPVQVTDATIKGLLKTCASEADNYIEVTTSAGMQTAFSDIAGSISKLRISH